MDGQSIAQALRFSDPRLERALRIGFIGVGIESLRWHGLFGRFGDKQSDWWAGLA